MATAIHSQSQRDDGLRRRRLPIGAEFVGDGTLSLRVWAPKRKQIAVCIVDSQPDDESIQPRAFAAFERVGRMHELRAESGGYFSATLDDVRPGQLYGFRLDDDPRLLPDPASRFQPRGPGGLSEFVDYLGFHWTDEAWRGIRPTGQVVYEMHVGTFTPSGTWDAAAEQFSELKQLGVTVLEVMPVADFPGSFGWGYDGTAMFAPTRLYGSPDDFRRFVDRAHATGLGIILDVVYNHFGNFGNYLGEFSQDYYTDRYQNEWAAAINFDGPASGPVREFFLANARYWIEEYHVDGYRFDATQCVFDASPSHILADACAEARRAGGARSIYLIAENEPQETRLVRPPGKGGFGLDALWNDDFHHAAHVRLTGFHPAYYSDYRGANDELIQIVKRGFLYQGQQSLWQEKPRGSSTAGLASEAFVSFLQNHDQVANSATGARVHQLTSPGRFRTMTALWLLGPQTPLLFQGQEFLSSAPFLFFADFQGADGIAVSKGRADFLRQFPELRTPEAQRRLADPTSRATFERCKLDFAEREAHRPGYDLHRDLLQLRREDPVFNRRRLASIDGASLSTECLMLRFFSHDEDDRMLIANFGPDFLYGPIALPLAAPPPGRGWELLWTSESPRYGGGCTPAVQTDAGLRIPAETTVVLHAVRQSREAHPEHLRRTHAESVARADETSSE